MRCGCCSYLTKRGHHHHREATRKERELLQSSLQNASFKHSTSGCGTRTIWRTKSSRVWNAASLALHGLIKLRHSWTVKNPNCADTRCCATDSARMNPLTIRSLIWPRLVLPSAIDSVRRAECSEPTFICCSGAGRDCVEQITGDYPELQWYADRAALVAQIGTALTGYAAKKRQYDLSEYAETAIGDQIGSIRDIVHQRLKQYRSPV